MGRRRRRALVALCAASGLASLGFAAAAGPAAIGLAAAVLALAAAHPVLKRIPFTKAAYLTGAWLTVVVAIPALVAPESRHAVRVAVSLGLSRAANAIASSLRDREAGAARVGRRTALASACGLAGLGLAVALTGPASVRPLACVSGATLLALAGFREGERYGMGVVDGALGAGALAALALGP